MTTNNSMNRRSFEILVKKTNPKQDPKKNEPPKEIPEKTEEPPYLEPNEPEIFPEEYPILPPDEKESTPPEIEIPEGVQEF